MKSERRHELQHNALADAIGDWSAKIKPHARMVAGGAILLFVLGVAIAYVTGKGEEKVVTGWDEYFDAISTGDRAGLTEIAEKYAGSSVAPWARVVAADIALAEGCSQVFAQKTEGRELLRQAVDNYQTVFREATDETLKQRALFGLGRGHESLAGVEDLTKARDDYKKLIDGWPTGVYADVAQERLADLERSSTKEFYDWFAKHEPPKAVSPSGKKPEYIEDALDKTDVALPSAFDDLKIDGPTIPDGKGPDNKGTDEKGLDDIELPDDTTPAPSAEPKAETPAEAKPE